MTKLVWDEAGTHFYESGVDRGVLYPINSSGVYQTGVAWNGLTNVSENPEGGDATDIWADNMKYGSMRAAEKAGGSISAYTYPDEFAACNGELELTDGMSIGQQPRQSFGFCYRTKIGNDLTTEAGYKIHIFYGCTCSPSSKEYATINDSPDAIELSWDFEANAVNVTGANPTATVVLDSTKLTSNQLTAVENALYGTTGSGSSANAYLPTPDALKTLITSASN